MLSYYFNFKIKCSFFNVKFAFLMNVLCILFLKRINFFSYHFVINVFKKRVSHNEHFGYTSMYFQYKPILIWISLYEYFLFLERIYLFSVEWHTNIEPAIRIFDIRLLSQNVSYS